MEIKVTGHLVPFMPEYRREPEREPADRDVKSRKVIAIVVGDYEIRLIGVIRRYAAADVGVRRVNRDRLQT